MKIHPLHSWNLTPDEAIALQRELAGKVDQQTPLKHCELIAGVDAAYGIDSSVFYAGIVVLHLPDMTVVERQEAVMESPFSYLPGLLSFREAPVLLEAFAKLKSEPDAVMLDGQGYCHPRRFGLACHVGLWLNRPCLGCGKTRLIGDFEEPAQPAGSRSPLMEHGEVIGDVVRTRDGVRPVFVSVGHRIDLDSAVRLVLDTCRGYRLPEPSRLAHQHVNDVRRRDSEE